MISGTEIAGDKNGDGAISGTEAAGDKNGDGTITFPEIAGDRNGDVKITGTEIAGNLNGDGYIVRPEIVGDSNGDGKISSNEIAGDINGDGRITLGKEIAGDTYGDGKITLGIEIAGDVNGDNKISGSEIAGDADGDGKISGSEIAGDLNGDGQITGNEIAGDINGDGKIVGNEIAGDINGDAKITDTEIAGDLDGDGVISSNEIAGDPSVQINSISNQIVCNGSNTLPVIFTSGNTVGTLTYSWNNSDKSIGLSATGIGNIAVFTTTNAGSSPVVATIKVTPSLTIGSQVRIGQSGTFTLTVFPTPAALSGTDKIVCPGSFTQLGGIPVPENTYLWSSVPTGFTSSVANPFVTPAQTTRYTVVESNAAGCSSTHTVQVAVKPTLKLLVSGPSILCAGSKNVVYSADPGMTFYQWAVPPGAIIVSGANSNTIGVDFSNAAFSGIVKATGVTDCGALIVSDSYAVNVNPLPPKPTFVSKDQILISSADLGNMWYLDGKAISASGTSKQFQVITGGSYSLLVSLNGCISEPSASYVLDPLNSGNIILDTYPNPTQGRFDLNIVTGRLEVLTIAIYDRNGRVQWKKDNVTVNWNIMTSIDLSFLPSASYVLRIYNSEIDKSTKIVIVR